MNSASREVPAGDGSRASGARATERVRLEEVAAGEWSLYFCDRLPARLDGRTHKLTA